MSDIFGEARITVVPDLTQFNTRLQTGVAAATAAASAQQERLVGTTAAAARGAKNLDDQSKKSAKSLLGLGSASAKLDSGLLGLRTALGSTAVIGLGAASLAAIAAGKAFRFMIASAAALEQEMNTFRVVSKATDEEMRSAGAAARALGADMSLPGVSAGDAAEALTELARAGLSVQDALAGAKGVLQLATAAQISNAAATEIVANSLNAFALSGAEAVRVADLLTGAANESQGSIEDMGLALKQSAAVASLVGINVQDTVTILTQLSQAGLSSSDAGTSFRTALVRLIHPTADVNKALDRLKINLRDTQGNIRPEIFGEIGVALQRLAPAARQATVALLGGADAVRAFGLLARDSTQGFEETRFQITQTGLAAEAASARTEGFTGSMQNLSNEAGTFGTTVGKPITTFLGSLADGFAGVFRGANLLASALGDNEFGPVVDQLTELEKQLAEVQKRLGDPDQLPFLTTLRKRNDELRNSIVQLRLSAKDRELKEFADAIQLAGKAGVPDIAKQLEGFRSLTASVDVLKGVEGESVSTTKALDDLITKLKGIRDVKVSVHADTSQLDRVIASLEKSVPAAREAAREDSRLTRTLGFLGSSASDTAGGVDSLSAALRNLKAQSFAANSELLKLQNEGAGPQAQIANLRGQRKIQEDLIASLTANGNQTGDATKINAAREQINSINAQIESLQGEITAGVEKIASDAEAERDKRQSAFERLLAAQLAPKERLLTRAGGTELLGDDIKFRKALIKILKDQIAQTRKTLGSTQEARDLIKGIQDRILTEALKIKQDRAAFTKQLHDALEAKFDRAQRGIELDIELADITENTRRQINLRLKLIAQLKKEAKALHLQGNALKENRNEQARLRKEIEDLRKEAEKTSNASSALFSFLQTQSGFAANLLGNLIPTGATSGLLGGTTGTGSGAGGGLSPPRQVSGGFEQVRNASRLPKSGTTGPSLGGQASQTQLLRQILLVLNHIYRGTGHPEAHHRRRTNPSAMSLDHLGT